MGGFLGFLVILFGICAACWSNVDADADTFFLRQFCNGGQFNAFDFVTPAATTSILENVIVETPKANLLNYYTDNTAAALHAHGLCTVSLSFDECADCMMSALHQLLEKCSNEHIGAQIQLRDCRLRYETYPFRDDY
ncbi:hypothetical protein MLD38_000135 [Melastoma candidum]|uniref:Uncharacterized protein n=1 Tax=Melastoma candidum TaxID=119954 RepID=A0ACB9SA10_9MYRT|nr:hypothetical protein MLD38_000135 [Melastoma candidum]